MLSDVTLIFHYSTAGYLYLSIRGKAAQTSCFVAIEQKF